MVSICSILFMLITLLFIFLMPVWMYLYLEKRYSISLKSVLVGGIVYIIAELIFKVPFVAYVESSQWYQWFNEDYMMYAVFWILEAAIVVEGIKYLVCKYTYKGKMVLKDALGIGLGFATLEAVLYVGANIIVNMLYSILINFNIIENYFPGYLGVGIADLITESLIEASPWLYIVAGLERLIVIPLAILASVLVYYAINRNKIRYLFMVVIFYFIVEGPLYYLGYDHLLLAEVYLFVIAAAATLYIRRLFKDNVLSQAEMKTSKVKQRD